MTDKLIAWDLEIFKIISEEEFKACSGNLWSLAPLGISVGAAVRSDGHKVSWHSGMGEPMTKSTARTMLKWLVEQYAQGWKIVTWNGVAFDCRLADEVADWPLVCKQLARVHYDPMLQFADRHGFRIGLQAVASGLRIGNKSLEAASAPVLWQSNEADCMKVIEYCVGDCDLTLQVAQHIQKKGFVVWQTKRGGYMRRKLGPTLRPTTDILEGTKEEVVTSSAAWFAF